MLYHEGKEVQTMKYLKIFTDFLEVVEPLGDGAAGRLFKAMLRYALNGDVPVLKGKEAVAWTVARQHMDREAAAYDDKVSSMARARKQKEIKQRSMSQPLISREDKEKDKDKNKDKDNEREYEGFAPVSAAMAASRARSMPPSLEEIESYCRERGNGVNAQRFMDFYTSNGWRIGKVPMKDWKAAVRSWETNGMDERTNPVLKQTELTDREIFQQAIELHRMKEAKQV